MIIRRFKREDEPSFFIARVGSCAGKPMKELTYNPNNVFAVFSDNVEEDFQKVKLAYELKKFHPFLRGSCQPAIRVVDCRHILEEMPNVGQKEYAMLRKIQSNIDTLAANLAQAKLLQMKFQYCIYQYARAA